MIFGRLFSSHLKMIANRSGPADEFGEVAGDYFDMDKFNFDHIDDTTWSSAVSGLSNGQQTGYWSLNGVKLL